MTNTTGITVTQERSFSFFLKTRLPIIFLKGQQHLPVKSLFRLQKRNFTFLEFKDCHPTTISLMPSANQMMLQLLLSKMEVSKSYTFKLIRFRDVQRFFQSTMTPILLASLLSLTNYDYQFYIATVWATRQQANKAQLKTRLLLLVNRPVTQNRLPNKK